MLWAYSGTDYTIPSQRSFQEIGIKILIEQYFGRCRNESVELRYF